MSAEDREKLLIAAHAARAFTHERRWELQTSNSFRRIGARGDGDVLCATRHPRDGHPDLLAAPGVLDWVIAAQPAVVIELLTDLDTAERELQKMGTIGEKIVKVHKHLTMMSDALDDAAERLSIAGDLDEARRVIASFRDALAEVQR